MLILKFIRKDNSGRQVDAGVSCAMYKAIHCDNGSFIITAYKTLTHADGFEYRLSLDNNPHNHIKLFVINEQGKTVDTYTPYHADPPLASHSEGK